ncbi:tumor necrosis factor receptor superfamily member 6 [Limosa lapponica baueri]|uniref:Tumor necrosis factor receptor superfamily member 6 n=1 Tax=Limosa lapponica baueri TaxID=1758121 RepID=A0A2I0TN02_LIMLA|nr:tumor necrosis factor receptor superfamily member 6 [Limosa lapponica baueri]
MVLIIEMQCKNHTERLINRTHSKLITRRIIAKREINCKKDEYNLDGQCCKKCKPGFVKKIHCPTDADKHCGRCEHGKEYIDHTNDLQECLRCSSCDRILAKPHQCQQRWGQKCESGIIEKKCTLTSDTVCGTADKRRRKSFTNKEDLPEAHAPVENKRLMTYADIDLSSHVTDIVEQMTLQDVMKFVRNRRVPEPLIDQTIRDYPNDTAEQKIKLFQVWYQRQGIKGAYRTLISSLRELRMRAAADKIEEKLKAEVPSCQEGGQSCSNDTEQSKTCTQENRNSDSDSAELNKTFSGHLEET